MWRTRGERNPLWAWSPLFIGTSLSLVIWAVKWQWFIYFIILTYKRKGWSERVRPLSLVEFQKDLFLEEKQVKLSGGTLSAGGPSSVLTKEGRGRELPMQYEISSFPVTGSRMQSLVWAIGFLVLHGLALAKTKFGLHSLSSHRWSRGSDSAPLCRRQTAGEWMPNAEKVLKTHVAPSFIWQSYWAPTRRSSEQREVPALVRGER